MEDCISPELLTIILTTSPTPSAPSPELVASVLASLSPQLSKVPIIVTFDGYTISKGKRLDGRLKKGQIPEEMASLYPQYIKNVQGLFGHDLTEEREENHVFISRSRETSVTFLRQKYRQGFGHSVKSALSHCQTPNVLILQHDWVFSPIHPLPMRHLVQILHEEEEVNYITFIARQSLRYEVSRGESLPQYKAVFEGARELRCGRPFEQELHACLHIFDRPHLCKVTTYRQLTRQLRRGDFIEDTIGTSYLRSIATAPTDSIEAWKVIGAWMFYEGIGDTPDIRHTSGRTVLSASLQAERIRWYIKVNQARKIEGDG